MAKSNHTPGPWRVSHDHGNNILRDTDTGPQMIGSAYYTNDPSPSYKDRQETLANARLMAAAPELLEACRGLLTFAVPLDAVEIEIEYAEFCLPRGVLGLNAALFRDYVQHIADRRLERVGLPVLYGSKNPFPWMSETIDLAKEKNFFETRVTEYQTSGTLSWD